MLGSLFFPALASPVGPNCREIVTDGSGRGGQSVISIAPCCFWKYVSRRFDDPLSVRLIPTAFSSDCTISPRRWNVAIPAGNAASRLTGVVMPAAFSNAIAFFGLYGYLFAMSFWYCSLKLFGYDCVATSAPAPNSVLAIVARSMAKFIA
jgi:hypothetical protein